MPNTVVPNVLPPDLFAGIAAVQTPKRVQLTLFPAKSHISVPG